jgi:hypothetical protein
MGNARRIAQLLLMLGKAKTNKQAMAMARQVVKDAKAMGPGTLGSRGPIRRASETPISQMLSNIHRPGRPEDIPF